MITKSYIESTLDELEGLYNSSSSKKKTIYYSKLATIELCGWIEKSMDDIVEKYCNRKLKNQLNKEYVVKHIVKPVYGFQYNRHFRPMLMKSVGIVQLEKLESKLDARGGKIEVLRSTLARLKTSRNNAAHTFIKGVTNSFDSPSIMKRDFHSIYPILKDIETEIRKV